MKRRPGHASVEEHPKGSGLYRVRARLGSKRPVLGKNLTLAAANALANAQASVRHAQVLREGLLLETFGVAFMARRADQGVRGVRKDELRWNKHIAAAPIGKLAVSSLLRSDIVEWRDQLEGSHRSKLKLLNLLRVALDEAVERGVLEANPAREVRLHRSGAARSTDDLEGILTPAEQVALMAAVPLRDRPCVVFALFTGLRLSEQWWLDWSDIVGGAVVVSKSVGGDPAKSGKVREVPMLPNALEALEVQRSFGRKGPILFPGARGARRTDTKAPLKFASWVKAAGIKRHVTWHDLRHTCATSLLAGWWGRKWSLDEVCKMLGHSSIAVTERYARKLNETLRLAVSNTPGLLATPGTGKELTVRNPLVHSAFVKHRSRVQVSQSAPVVAARVLGPSCGQSEADSRRRLGGDHEHRDPAPTERHSGQLGTLPRHLSGWFGPTPPPSSPGDFAGLPQGWG